MFGLGPEWIFLRGITLLGTEEIPCEWIALDSPRSWSRRGTCTTRRRKPAYGLLLSVSYRSGTVSYHAAFPVVGAGQSGTGYLCLCFVSLPLSPSLSLPLYLSVCASIYLLFLVVPSRDT